MSDMSAGSTPKKNGTGQKSTELTPLKPIWTFLILQLLFNILNSSLYGTNIIHSHLFLFLLKSIEIMVAN